MFSILSTIGPEIPFSLALLAMLGLRVGVHPRVSLWINAAPEKVFPLVDLHDGKIEDWGRTVTTTERIDKTSGIFRKTYNTTLSTGVTRSFSALFSIAQRTAPEYISLKREGLEGKSHANELLEQNYRLTPERGGTRLDIDYVWGARPLIAQLIARTDLWGGIYRLKGLAETGSPNERPFQIISGGVAIVTGLITMAGFTLLLHWEVAALLIFALFIHEFGHLLAYRLMGQPWGRMIFLPFLGAIAMPRLPFESQGQAVFAALMGPGFSTLLAIACALPPALGFTLHPVVGLLGVVTVLLNIFNLLPVEPLDGGVALRSVLSRIMGRWARFGLMLVGALLIIVGFAMNQILLMIFGGIAILANIKERSIDAGLTPLTSLQITISFFSYVTMITAYITLLRYFGDLAALLPK